MSTNKLLIAITILLSLQVSAQRKNKTTSTENNSPDAFQSSLFSGLKFRSIGPAKVSGRIVDLAVNPGNIAEYYVAAANSGVWKTTNSGITFSPVFDEQPSFSIGCITMDPNNPSVLWVGSGENNNQRVVGYGDGVYKSEDAGRSWKNMGLKTSEHIGKIVVDPTNSDIVFVAAYGPLWSSGGERGIYKTTDGGKTWKAVLTVSENTGFNEVHMDPRNSNVLYAAAHQRQRKVFTYIGGGPESALYKSTDGGEHWSKIMNGLPANVDLGRMGLAISPVNPDHLYLIVEAADGKGGLFSSMDRGASWQKKSSYTTSGNYYQELFCDPVIEDRLYSMNVYLQVSDDGGKSFHNLGEKSKHVDNHVIWINPDNSKQMRVGCDGGLYETFDAGENWDFKSNLPITQFYKVSLDNSFPFYYVYGGTQDNFSLGGPSRTISGNGITNADWFITNGGDGFESQADYVDSNIVYAEAQYGGLVRYDRKSGESINIKPVEPLGEAPYRWNWDAPLLISRHDHKRLYFASNKIFRTDDQGSSWRVISPDMSRGLDRNKLTVMGKVWSVDAVAKNGSTDIFGQVTTIAESPIDEQLLYAGTDDGLVQVSSNGGGTWTKIDRIPGVPGQTYVNMIIASAHDRNVAYAAFNHHRYGDFHPYLYKTSDAGKTWLPIQHNLPERGTVYCMAEDPGNANLLFAGTEFGVYFSIDGGGSWTQLKGGLPPAAIKDMEIQPRDKDLVVATFGRGYYVLDDYTPLRNLQKTDLQKAAFISPVKTTWMFIESMPLGIRGKSFQGESYWSVPNPKPGAVFTYYLRNDIKTLKERRQEAEKALIKIGDAPFYPSMDSLRAEDQQPAPYLQFVIHDKDGTPLRYLTAPAKKGINRITWDYRSDIKRAVSFTPFDENRIFSSEPKGILMMPGTYQVSLNKFEDGVFTQLVAPQPFSFEALNLSSLPQKDRNAVLAFGKKVEELYRVVEGTDEYKNDLAEKLRYIKQAVLLTPSVSPTIIKNIMALEQRLGQVRIALNGDAALARREFEAPTSYTERVADIMDALVSTTGATTQSFINQYEEAAGKFSSIYNEIKAIDNEVKQLESLLEKNAAPYTPGRLPVWK